MSQLAERPDPSEEDRIRATPASFTSNASKVVVVVQARFGCDSRYKNVSTEGELIGKLRLDSSNKLLQARARATTLPQFHVNALSSSTLGSKTFYFMITWIVESICIVYGE